MSRVDESYILKHFFTALEEGRIQAFYQPVYSSFTNRIVSAEALTRWFDPDIGMLSPADFIPVLERHGLIFDLDMEILRQTCAVYRESVDRGTPFPCFSVNLSRLDFSRRDSAGRDSLFDTVVGILDGQGVPHHVIRLEITESMMLEDTVTFQDVFRQFTDAGFSFWLDDFGSAYSSLNVLQNYPFDVIKFDLLFLRSFSPKGRSLLASLIGMAKSLGIHTLTEGVETARQREFLLDIGCELQQGFYHSKPLSRADFTALVGAGKEAADSPEDVAYWKQIGRVNFLSANPLKEYELWERSAGGDPCESATEKPGYGNGVPLALVECGQNTAHYVYASKSHVECLRRLGYRSLDDVEHDFNDRRSDQYLLIKKLITDAIESRTIKTVEYSNNNVYYRLSAKCLATREDTAMLALTLTAFDSEHEVRTAKEMLTYGNSLFPTYDLAVLFYPDSGLAKRIYSANSIPSYDRAGSLDASLQGFTKTHVAPVDQDRYLRFIDFSTLAKRIEASPKGCIQNTFRLSLGFEGKDAGVGNWYTARVSRIPTMAERAFILTIQSLPANEARVIDVIAAEHPELLE